MTQQLSLFGEDDSVQEELSSVNWGEMDDENSVEVLLQIEHNIRKTYHYDEVEKENSRERNRL